MQRLRTRWGYASPIVTGPYTGKLSDDIMANCFYITGSPDLGSGELMVWLEFPSLINLKDKSGILYASAKGGSADVYLNGTLMGTFPDSADAKSQAIKELNTDKNVVAAILSSPAVSVAIGVFDATKVSLAKSGAPWSVRFL